MLLTYCTAWVGSECTANMVVTNLTMFVLVPALAVYTFQTRILPTLRKALRSRTLLTKGTKPGQQVPVSVNYFFTRQCNKACGFCFHTAKTSHMEPLDRAKEGLRLLAQAGARKLNFAGGEPFLYPDFLGALVEYCKNELALESVSIITNGSLVKEEWFERYGAMVDVFACSCDSFDEPTNVRIGRGTGNQVEILYNIAQWCRAYRIKFKLNTVVCRHNFAEDMNAHIEQLQPFRWKAFQVLIVKGENDCEATLRDARDLTITADEYKAFCDRHRHHKSFIPESNRIMASSYLLVDEYFRFIDKDVNKLSDSILDVGVHRALGQIHFDEDAFMERGGLYDWGKEKPAESTCPAAVSGKELEW